MRAAEFLRGPGAGLFRACLLAVVPVLLAAPAARPAATEPRPPNVVLIISDDHAWTDYGFMGHPQIRTPHLDRLAGQSLVYRRGYVPSSLCCPSLASIITGLYPHQHRITGNDPPTPPGTKRGDPAWQQAFREGREVMNRHLEAVPTLPRLLGERGYLSLQTGKWWQGDYRRGGFTHGMTRGDRHGDDGLTIGRQSMAPIYDFVRTAREAKRPFFVWYAPLLPHDPHTPPERLLQKYRDTSPSLHVARYRAMVEWFDETCGDLMGFLDREGLAGDTLVAYVTDNGWIQSLDNPRYAPKSKQSPYDGGLRTPIMLRLPGRVKPGTSDELALSIDLAPTILKLLGARPPARMPGIDLLDAEAVRRRRAIQGACFQHTTVDLNDPAKNLRWRWGIEEGWKLIVPADPAEKPELYDLHRDPHEETNLAARHPERAAALLRGLDRWWNPAGPGGGG